MSVPDAPRPRADSVAAAIPGGGQERPAALDTLGNSRLA